MEQGTVNKERFQARQEELVVKEMPDEVLVYDLKRHEAHCLNKTAAFIWQHCDGQTSIAEMATLLTEEAGSPVDEEVIWYGLERLQKADLLEGESNLPVKDGLSRRRMIKRLGVVMALPAVISIIAPSSVSAATVVITRFKIANGQCENQDNPQQCSDDTCCTGSPKKLCIAVGPSPTPGQVNTSCVGSPCEPAGNASPCSSG